jgi:hypothetical protein
MSITYTDGLSYDWKQYNTITETLQHLEASYIIYTDGTTTYAKSGTTGQIEFSNTDASKVIQYAIDSLPYGGKIFIKAGTYIISQYIQVKSNIELCGEGFNTVLKAGNNLQELSPGRSPILYLGHNVSNIAIHDLAFNFNITNQTSEFVIGIYLWGTNKIRIYNNLFEELATTAPSGVDPVGIFATEYLGSYDDNQNINISNNIFNIPNGLFSSNFVMLTWGKNITIKGNIVNCSDTIVYIGSAKSVDVIGNLIIGSAALDIPGGTLNYPADSINFSNNIQISSGRPNYTTAGYMIGLWQGANGNTIRNVKIKNNIIFGDTSQTRVNAIWINQNQASGTITDVEISGNFINCLSGQTITQTAIVISYNTLTDAKIVIKDNRIYNGLWQGMNISNVKNLVVEDNYVYNCGSDDYPSQGIYISNCASVVVKSNFVDNSRWNNIEIYQSQNVSVMGNIAKNSRARYGICVCGSATAHAANVIISGNSCFDDKDTKTQTYGIVLEYIDKGICSGNLVLNNLNAGIYPVGNLTNFVIRGNVGYVTENSGQAVFSGTGTQTTFTIAHGLTTTPNKVLVTAGSADAKGDFYVTVDATNIYVTYATAPPAGTNNVVLYWRAEV